MPHHQKNLSYKPVFVRFLEDVKIDVNNMEVNANSVMNLIAACIKFGTEINIVCDGEDEQEALNEAVSMVESGFGEK